MGIFNFKKKKNQNKIEKYFSNIDSVSKAKEEFKNNNLSKIYLFPLEFGGVDDPINILYVPSFVVDAKNSIDRTVMELLEQELVDDYSCSPLYKGESFIPSKLIIKVTGKREFNSTIDIW